MKACNLTMTFDALRDKLGLPPEVRVVAVGNYGNVFEEVFFTLWGIGPETKPGDTLQNVKGVLSIKTEGGLSWEIK